MFRIKSETREHAPIHREVPPISIKWIEQQDCYYASLMMVSGGETIPIKLFTFAKTCYMINNEQIKDLSERRDALRRYL
jgi:hypothetical protein